MVVVSAAQYVIRISVGVSWADDVTKASVSTEYQ